MKKQLKHPEIILHPEIPIKPPLHQPSPRMEDREVRAGRRARSPSPKGDSKTPAFAKRLAATLQVRVFSGFSLQGNAMEDWRSDGPLYTVPLETIGKP